MSRTSPETKKTPVKRYLKVDGDTGEVVFWDKESKTEVSFPKLEMILMDTLSSVGGWSDPNNANIYSNMVRYTKDKVTLRCANKEIYSGSYADNKEKIKSIGGKFETNLFALAKMDDELVPVCLKLSGAALKVWMDFSSNVDNKTLYGSTLVFSSSGEKRKKGKVEYVLPQIAVLPLAPEEAKAADDFNDNVLAPYLSHITSFKSEEAPSEVMV